MSSHAADSLAPLSLPVAAPDHTRALEAEVLGLFDECAASLARYVRSCGLRPDAADDVVQETFIALFQHLRNGRPRDNLQGWLFTVAHRKAQKHRSRATRLQAVEAPFEQGEIDAEIATSRNPESLLAEQQTRRRLLSVFHALPERHRQCLALRAEGLRYRDIAQVLGISLGGVAKTLAHAVLRLSAVAED